MSTYWPPVSNMPSISRRLRPLSMTCVSPSVRGLPGRAGRSRKPFSKAGIELLQLLLRGGLHVVVERVAVGVDPDGERTEVLDAELPEALGHQLLPGDLLDLLDLRRLERRRASDDREVDHPEPLHRLDRLVGEAALAADRAHAVLRAERLGEAHHARARGRADADGVVLSGGDGWIRNGSIGHFRRNSERSPLFLRVGAASGALVVALADAGGGVEQERAPEIHRRRLPLVEDPDLRPVAEADDVALDDDLVAGAQLQDLALVSDRERDFVACHA